MEKSLVLTTFLIVSVLTIYAQSDYSFYLSQTWENLNAGNCDAAQRSYNVFKELTDSRNTTIEEAIDNCFKNVQKQQEKSYSIGDDAYDFVGTEGWKIAYLDNSGKHGFAVKEEKAKSYKRAKGFVELVEMYNNGESDLILSPPTVIECNIMYRNKYSLKLQGEYWAVEKEDILGHVGEIIYDFSSGTYSKIPSRSNKSYTAKVLVVNRF